MLEKNLQVLQPRLIGEECDEVESALDRMERLFDLPDSYRMILKTIRGGVAFDLGARFKSDEPSPLADEQGFLGLEILYGPGDGRFGIERYVTRYEDELPPSLVPIGASFGGNLVCIDSKTGAIFFWHHESLRGEGTWRVAPSFDEFLDRLEPEEPGIGPTDGVIESETFLDF